MTYILTLRKRIWELASDSGIIRQPGGHQADSVTRTCNLVTFRLYAGIEMNIVVW